MVPLLYVLMIDELPRFYTLLHGSSKANEMAKKALSECVVNFTIQQPDEHDTHFDSISESEERRASVNVKKKRKYPHIAILILD